MEQAGTSRDRHSAGGDRTSASGGGGETVIRSSSPLEVLALAEHTLGFRPRESLVVVSLRPPRWRTGVVGRVDVEAADDRELVGQLVQHLVADGAARCFLALVTDAGEPPAGRPPRRGRAVVPAPRRAREDRGAPAPLAGLLRLPGSARAELVCAALAAAGVEPEPWLVHRGRLYSYACDRSCCPASGRSLQGREATQVAAEMVLAGRVLPADRESWELGLRRSVAAVPPAAGAGAGGSGGSGGQGGPGSAADVAAVGAALASRARRRPPAERDVLRDWRDLLTAQSRRDGAGLRLAPAEVAVLLAALRRLPLRDQLLAVAVPQALPELAGALAPAADPGAALAVLQQLARRAPARWRAAATGCAAYVAWCTGASPAAGVWAQAALELDPAHSLSALVLQAVSVGLPPPGREPALGPAGGPDGRW
ncbi:DUF4192 family protein [Quadrisphaera sp. KR29]|uniref:DUF4192 family protein n=1 Tax=Quadrisphaera sp. KR29 TaxID=3461391 RepID=UPI0040450A4F